MPKTLRQVFLERNAKSPPPYTCMSMATNGHFLAAGGKEGIVNIWNYEDGELITSYEGRVGSLRTIAMSHTGLKVATGGDSALLCIRDLNDLSLATTVIKSPQPNICGIVWSPDDRLFATHSRDGSVCLWDGRPEPVHVCPSVRLLSNPEVTVQDVKFSPDSTRLVTIYGTYGDDFATLAALWDTSSGQLITTLSGHEETILALAVAPDGRIATGSMDSTCQIWSAGGHERFTFGQSDMPVYERYDNNRRTVSSVAFSPGGKDIAIGWSSGRLEIRDSMFSGELRHSFKYGCFAINSIAYSHTGRLVAIGCNAGGTVVWDTVSKEMIVEIVDKDRDTVEKVMFAPDDQYLITHSRLGLLHVYRLRGVLDAERQGPDRSQCFPR